MRNLALLALLLAACGGSDAKDDANTNPGIDAYVLPPCSNIVHGTQVSMRKLDDHVDGVAILVTAPPNDPRLFVIEEGGRIRVFKDEHLVDEPFLDISDENGGPVVAGGEQGLLGLAFHPDYATNGTFFVFYTGNNPQSGGDRWVNVLARYQVDPANPDKALPEGTIVLSIPDPFTNHNGGMMEFGADGLLYIGTGDGGDGGDPRRNGQNPNALLGKILRVDVDHKATGKEYGIPTDNPFADGTAGAPEVFMLGVRNPWRWSFDRGTGTMWVADVGQNVTEEINVLKSGEQKGANLGWSAYEASACCATQGDHCSQSGTQQPCDPNGLWFPQDERLHGAGWNAIIGGQVYRGTCYPDIVGNYYYTDNGKGGMALGVTNADGTYTFSDLPNINFPQSPSSLHADARGELWETDTVGNLYHLEAAPAQ